MTAVGGRERHRDRAHREMSTRPECTPRIEGNEGESFPPSTCLRPPTDPTTTRSTP
jgi:hypothetical protein